MLAEQLRQRRALGLHQLESARVVVSRRAGSFVRGLEKLGITPKLYRERFAHYGHGTPQQAIVGLGGQVFMRANSQDAVREFRPYFDNAPVYGHGPSLEDFSEMTPLTVGSPQQVIDRYAAMRETFGDYQRQLFLIDHAGLPTKTVLEQLDILGGEVVPT